MKIDRKDTATCSVQVFMAGDLATAKAYLRRECYQRGLCVTVTPTTFIYTGGEEDGFVVGFQNYPRFPTEPLPLVQRARTIAENLLMVCSQRSALLVAPDRTEWLTTAPPGASE